jgi:AAA15 family ATPase/GTPase
MSNNEQSQHLEYFKVENFKGLESLELKEIQQFNLILGDNNIGKTSVLEALLFDEVSYDFLVRLKSVYFSKADTSELSSETKNEVNYLNHFINSNNRWAPINYIYKFDSKQFGTISLEIKKVSVVTDEELNNLIKNTFLSFNDLPKDIVRIQNNNRESFLTFDLSLHKTKSDILYHPFVRSKEAYAADLVYYFSMNVNNSVSKKHDFVSDLHILSNEIADITIDTTTIPNNPILLVLFKDEREPLPLYMFGDGTIRLVRLILEIIASQGKRLMIDEIDNGMHFSKMKKVWEVVLKVAAKYNTQLFVTTHDAECLRAFKEVLESEELKHLQEKVASYTLFRNKEDKVDSVKYNFQEFEHAIDYSLNVRG